MRIKTTIATAVAVAAVPLAGPAIVDAAGTDDAGAGAPTARAAAVFRQFEGTVTSVNAGARTFRLRDAERGTVTIATTSATRYERVAGFGGLRAGLSRIEVRVRRSDGRWIARSVERSGGGGTHRGGDDNRGGSADDNRGRGGDDRGTDDHGGHGGDDRGGDDHGGGRGRGRGGSDD